MKIEVILLCHGASPGGTDRRYAGQTANQPLSERGKRELLSRKAHGAYPPAEALYVSPLSRCTETARLLYPMLVPVILPSLAELDVGSFEGKTYEQLKDDPSYQRWRETGGRAAPPGGESGEAFAQRLLGAMRQIAADSRSGAFHSAAVITHSSCIRTLAARLCPPAESGADGYGGRPVSSGGGYRVKMDADSLRFDNIFSL
ncbi:MAG TPA: histidine phosphatase family protein [Firmicutes bacterium]|nr:histidine phosphatase family protein [Bacillota bacterium]